MPPRQGGATFFNMPKPIPLRSRSRIYCEAEAVFMAKPKPMPPPGPDACACAYVAEHAEFVCEAAQRCPSSSPAPSWEEPTTKELDPRQTTDPRPHEDPHSCASSPLLRNFRGWGAQKEFLNNFFEVPPHRNSFLVGGDCASWLLRWAEHLHTWPSQGSPFPMRRNAERSRRQRGPAGDIPAAHS